MTVAECAQTLSLRYLAGEAGAQNEISGGYVGDLLSWVMGRLEEGQAWITVMGNINAIAVATLKDASCIILTDEAPLDEDARRRAELEGVPVLVTEKNSYQTALALGQALS